MRPKSLVILGAILVILITLALVKMSMKPEVATTEKGTDIIANAVGLDNLTEVILRLGDGSVDDENKPKTVHMAKENDKWVVKSHYGAYADEKVITPILDKVDALEGELRSSKANLFEDYGISDTKALHVFLHNNTSEVAHLVIGAKRAGGQNNFVRLGGTAAVYLVDENLLSQFGVRTEGEDISLDSNKWLDKHIVHFDPNSVDSVEISEIQEGVERKIVDIKREIVDNKKKWTPIKDYSFGLSGSKIKNYVQSVTNTYARETISPDEAKGVFESTIWKTVFRLDDGKQITIIRGDKDNEGRNYYVKSQDAGYMFLVPISTMDRLNKTDGDFFVDNPLKVEEKNIAEMKIRDIEQRKEITAMKTIESKDEESSEETSEEQQAEKTVLWKTEQGEILEEKEIKDVINKLRALSFMTVSETKSSIDNLLLITIKEKKDEKTTNYAISKSVTLEDNNECHYLKIGEDSYGYCIAKNKVEELKKAASLLYN